MVPAIKNTLPMICRKLEQFHWKIQFVLPELALVTDIIKYILWTRCCAENQAVPEQLLALKFTKYRRRIWVGKFITQHPSRVYRNCKVFPLPGSLFRYATCLCVTNDSEEALSDDVSVSLGLLNRSAPSIWPCVLGGTYYYFTFCPKCTGPFLIPGTKFTGCPLGLEPYCLQNNWNIYSHWNAYWETFSRIKELKFHKNIFHSKCTGE